MKLRFFRRARFRDLFPRLWIDWNGDRLTISLSVLVVDLDPAWEAELSFRLSSRVMEFLAPRWERWREKGWVN